MLKSTMLKSLTILTCATYLFSACASAQTSTQRAPNKGITIHFKTGSKNVTITVKDADVVAYVNNKVVSNINVRTLAFAQPVIGGGTHVATITPFSNWGLPARANLGVNVGEISRPLAEHLDVGRKKCVIVLSVHKGQAAEKAGLKKHDIITEIDGKSPVTRSSLKKAIAKKNSGDKIRLTILRKGTPMGVEAKLGKTPVYGRGITWGATDLAIPHIYTGNALGLLSKGQLKPIKALDWVDLATGRLSPGSGYRLVSTTAIQTKALAAEIAKLRTDLRRLEKLLGSLRKKDK